MYIYLFRILLCFLLSILIGIERQYRHKTVGLRTNVLVSLGSFMFVSMSFKVSNPDLTRIAAQVVSGIGFLGAGVIIKDGNKVKGLNTAATLWCVSAIGVLCAAGMYIEAILGTVFILISNIILRIISQKIMENITINDNFIINITCINNEIIKNNIIKLIYDKNLNLDKFEKNNISKSEINYKFYVSSNEKISYDELTKIITLNNDINYILIEQNKDITNEIDEDDE